jgi:hypothetical protein
MNFELPALFAGNFFFDKINRQYFLFNLIIKNTTLQKINLCKSGIKSKNIEKKRHLKPIKAQKMHISKYQPKNLLL